MGIVNVSAVLPSGGVGSALPFDILPSVEAQRASGQQQTSHQPQEGLDCAPACSANKM